MVLNPERGQTNLYTSLVLNMSFRRFNKKMSQITCITHVPHAHVHYVQHYLCHDYTQFMNGLYIVKTMALGYFHSNSKNPQYWGLETFYIMSVLTLIGSISSV